MSCNNEIRNLSNLGWYNCPTSWPSAFADLAEKNDPSKGIFWESVSNQSDDPDVNNIPQEWKKQVTNEPSQNNYSHLISLNENSRHDESSEDEDDPLWIK